MCLGGQCGVSEGRIRLTAGPTCMLLPRLRSPPKTGWPQSCPRGDGRNSTEDWLCVPARHLLSHTAFLSGSCGRLDVFLRCTETRRYRVDKRSMIQAQSLDSCSPLNRRPMRVIWRYSEQRCTYRRETSKNFWAADGSWLLSWNKRTLTVD